MDQGFNDDELADIMNEIESLEQEFTDDSTEQKDNDAQHESEDVNSELAHASTESIDKAHHEAHDDKNVHSLKQQDASSKNWPSTSLDFSVEGDMKMNLFFNVSGKTVHLHINDGVFEIELEGGMKFSIPVDSDQKKKAA